MLIFDTKKYIEDALRDKAEKYCEDNNLSHLFSQPILAYASAKDPLFMAFFEEGWTLHPKEIYRPSNTVLIHFLPFKPRLSQADFSQAKDSSILFSAILNDTIKEGLEKLGRLASLTGLPGDWNEETDRPNWSHKLAAYIAGMGEFGLASSFNTEKGNLGRFDSILSEVILEPSIDRGELKEDAIKNILQNIRDSKRFSPKESLSENLAPIDLAKINSCPAKAINQDYIDKEKCRDYCRSLGHITPASDTCARCFNPHGV